MPGFMWHKDKRAFIKRPLPQDAPYGLDFVFFIGIKFWRGRRRGISVYMDIRPEEPDRISPGCAALPPPGGAF